MQNMFSENFLRISTKLIRSPPSVMLQTFFLHEEHSKSTQRALKGQSKDNQRTLGHSRHSTNWGIRTLEEHLGHAEHLGIWALEGHLRLQAHEALYLADSYTCHEFGYAELAFQQRKIIFNCLEKVHTLNNY